MENIIHRDKLEEYLKADGSIFKLISKQEESAMKKLLFGNMTNWEKISSLPEYVYHSFDMKMRRDCYVSEIPMTSPPEGGPHIIFSKGKDDEVSIQIDNDDRPRGILHYRRCLTVVAYYVGILGGDIHPTVEKDVYRFTDEDWIIISMAARFCLMPPKFIKKIYILTQMYADENSAAMKGQTFLNSFVDHLAYQTDVPEWVVWSRLREHAYADDEFTEIIARHDLESIVEEYRKNEHYTAPLV